MRTRIFRFISLLTLFSLTACNAPTVLSSLQPAAPVAISRLILATADPNASPTPTPFQPIPPTATFNPTEFPLQSDAPVQSAQASPNPTLNSLGERLPRPEGQVNILILGSDYRPNSGYRTDVILLAALNPNKGTVNLVSFPRDLWVNIPGWEAQRINTAQAHGGFALTQATFEQNFGVHPDYYIMTNFNGFRGIVNTLGGIDVQASQSLSDKCDLPQAVNGYCNVSPGTVHMNGDTALWYVRSRYSTSDFDRLRRAQEVIQAIFYKMMSLNAVSRAPEIFNEFISSVETNMTLNDMLPLLPLASQLASGNGIQRYSIGPAQVTSWVTPQGADVLLPNQAAISAIIDQALFGK
ncbi:MAG: LCP family protein [Chloroflexi bacterium]|nr:LCP family protein [Chloroflexota bacterium]